MVESEELVPTAPLLANIHIQVANSLYVAINLSFAVEYIKIASNIPSILLELLVYSNQLARSISSGNFTNCVLTICNRYLCGAYNCVISNRIFKNVSSAITSIW